MSLSLAINNAMSGLRVAQRSLDVTSHNISNVQTEGFSRKTKPQESQVIGGVGSGVTDSEVQRTVDTALQRELWRQTSVLKAHETQETYLQRIEQISGRPEDETSIAAMLSRLRAGFESLTATPESTTLQLDAISRASELARNINQLSQSILRIRNDVQIELDRTIDDTNALLQQLSEYNNDVVTSTQAGRSIADSLDQRDLAMKKLSELTEVTIGQGADNRIIVLTRPGLTLIDKQPQTLSFAPAELSYDSYYRFVPPGTVSTVPAESAVSPIRIGDATSGADVTTQLSGGKIGTLLDLRGKTLPTMQAQLDELAHKLALRFQTAGMTLFTGADGQTVPVDQAGSYVGFAGEIRVAAAATRANFLQYGDNGSPTTPPNNAISNGTIERVLNFAFGSTANAAGTAHANFRSSFLGPDAIANLQSTLPTSGTIEEFARSLITDQGQRRADATRYKETSDDLTSSLEARLSNTSGVNLDEELAQLTILQRAYGASAQLLRTAQTLLDDLFAAVR